jgi:predicted transcriptional regulator
MPLVREVKCRLSEAEWEELEVILERRQETVSQYLRYLIQLGLITSRALYNRDPF